MGKNYNIIRRGLSAIHQVHVPSRSYGASGWSSLCWVPHCLLCPIYL